MARSTNRDTLSNASKIQPAFVQGVGRGGVDTICEKEKQKLFLKARNVSTWR